MDVIGACLVSHQNHFLPIIHSLNSLNRKQSLCNATTPKIPGTLRVSTPHGYGMLATLLQLSPQDSSCNFWFLLRPHLRKRPPSQKQLQAKQEGPDAKFEETCVSQTGEEN